MYVHWGDMELGVCLYISYAFEITYYVFEAMLHPSIYAQNNIMIYKSTIYYAP